MMDLSDGDCAPVAQSVSARYLYGSICWAMPRLWVRASPGACFFLLFAFLNGKWNLDLHPMAWELYHKAVSAQRKSRFFPQSLLEWAVFRLHSPHSLNCGPKLRTTMCAFYLLKRCVESNDTAFPFQKTHSSDFVAQTACNSLASLQGKIKTKILPPLPCKVRERMTSKSKKKRLAVTWGKPQWPNG